MFIFLTNLDLFLYR